MRGSYRARRLVGFGLIVGVVSVTAVDAHAQSQHTQHTQRQAQNQSAASARPGPTNTGVPASTTLTRHDGNITVTHAGVVINALDVHGFVIVEASNVTIKNSIVRGSVSHGDTALVKVVSGTNVVVEDSELVPEFPSVQIDAIRGANYTVLRDNIHGTTDGAKITGSNVMITHSYIHDLPFWASDPDQGGKPAHNDGVEIFLGHNLTITDNTFAIATYGNSAMQVTQNLGVVTNLHFTGNYANGGKCTVNVSNLPRTSMSGIHLDDNRFGRDTSISNCAILAKNAVTLTHVDDVWDDTGAPVTLRRAA